MVQSVVTDIREDESGIETAGLNRGAAFVTLKALTGTVAVNKDATAVTGTGTAFDTEIAVDDFITIGEDKVSYKVTAIASATSLTIGKAYEGANVSGKKIRFGRVDAANTLNTLASVEGEYGTSSKCVDSAKAAFNSGLRPVTFQGLPVKFDSTETFTTASSTVTNKPIHEVVSATRGSALTVKYTVDDPDTKSPGATEIFINTKTGKYKTGATVDGTNTLILTLRNYDLTSAAKYLVLELPEYVTLAGFTFEPKYHGFWDELLTLAGEADKNWLLAVGLAYGADRTEAELKKFLETYRDADSGKRISPLHIKAGSGDLSSGYMALRAKSPTNGKDKLQSPPAGITVTEYTPASDYGDQEKPAAGTWHALGVNTVTKFAGRAVITNSRAMRPDGDFNQFNFRFRLTREADIKLSDAATNAMAGAPDSLPYSTAGIAMLDAALRAAAGALVRAGKYEKFIINLPDIDDPGLTETLKKNAIVDLIEIHGQQTGQIMLVKQTLKVKG